MKEFKTIEEIEYFYAQNGTNGANEFIYKGKEFKNVGGEHMSSVYEAIDGSESINLEFVLPDVIATVNKLSNDNEIKSNPTMNNPYDYEPRSSETIQNEIDEGIYPIGMSGEDGLEKLQEELEESLEYEKEKFVENKAKIKEVKVDKDIHVVATNRVINTGRAGAYIVDNKSGEHFLKENDKTIPFHDYAKTDTAKNTISAVSLTTNITFASFETVLEAINSPEYRKPNHIAQVENIFEVLNSPNVTTIFTNEKRKEILIDYLSVQLVKYDAMLDEVKVKEVLDKDINKAKEKLDSLNNTQKDDAITELIENLDGFELDFVEKALKQKIAKTTTAKAPVKS